MVWYQTIKDNYNQLLLSFIIQKNTEYPIFYVNRFHPDFWFSRLEFELFGCFQRLFDNRKFSRNAVRSHFLLMDIDFCSSYLGVHWSGRRWSTRLWSRGLTRSTSSCSAGTSNSYVEAAALSAANAAAVSDVKDAAISSCRCRCQPLISTFSC